MPRRRSQRVHKSSNQRICQKGTFSSLDAGRPAAASRRVHMLCVGTCLAFAIWVWLLNPIDYLFDDQLNIVTLQLAQDYPENFARDPIYGGGVGGFYPSLCRVIITRLVNWFGLIGGHRVAQFSLSVAYMVVMYFVLYVLTRSPPAALLVSLFSLLWRDSMGGSYWGLDRMQAVQPRSLVLIWAPLLLLMAWKFRHGLLLLAVFGLLGLLINISPPGALFLAIPIWIATLAEGRPTKQQLLKLGGALAALTVGAAPFIYSHLTARIGASGALSAPEQQLFMEALQFRFSRMSSFPVPLDTVCTVVSGFSLPILLAMAGWAVRRQKRGALDYWLLTIFLITAIGYVVVQYLMQKISMALDFAPPVVNVHRGQKYAYLVLYIYAAIFLQWLFTQIGRFERGALFVAALAFIVTVPFAVFVKKATDPRAQWETNVSHFRQLLHHERIVTNDWYGLVLPVARWIRNNTPSNSLVLFGHRNMPVFRFYALRSMVSSEGSGGIALYGGPQRLIHWYKAQKILSQTSTKRDVGRLVKLAEETGSDYIILSKNAPSVPGWTPVFVHRYWLVYKHVSAATDR